MSSSNRYSLVGNVDLSSFGYTFKPDDSPIYHDHTSAQPLRYTKSNNAVPSFSEQPRPDSSMLRSHSDFDFSDSSTGVGAGCFVQSNSISPFPGPRSAPSSYQGLGPLPINKFLTDSNSPWTGFRTSRNSRIHPAFAEPNLNFATYRHPPQSEIESNTTAQCHSDSGYASQPVASQSVKSGEYSSSSPDYSYYPDFDNFDLSPMPKASVSPQQPGEEGAMKSTQRTRGGKRKCEKCNEILKCPSDYRKHMLKHDKPNKCNIPGCARVDGFSTINDLQRHKKSKHGIGLDSITTSFKCASPSCKNQEKIWPRRDNFKQHIIRMHKDEDVNELISRSEIKGGTSTDGASIEADLAGMSRYAEPQPSTVRPGELDMGNSETLVTTSAAWLQPTLSGEPVAHRSDAIPARERSSQIQINYSSLNRLHRNNVSSQDLDTVAIVPAIHPKIDPNRQGSSLGHEYASNTSSGLASPDGQLVYNPIEAEQGFHDPNFLEKLAIFQNATDEERKRILEIIIPDSLGGGDMEHDDRSSGSSPSPQIKKKNKVCTTCGKAFEKKASLNKHMQRHTRPWACTHFACNKTFGAKDDWKRHERSQAPQAELWLCQMPDPDPASSSGNCAVVEFDRHCFHEHLREDHNFTIQTDIDNMTLKCKIGYSHQWLNAYCQVNFWCGFCRKVIQADHDPHKLLSSTGASGTGKGQDDNDPANHRWDHIDAHFKEGSSIESWLFWEANKTLGEVESLKDAKFVWDVYGKENPEREKLRKQRARKEKLKPNISQAQVGEKRKAEDELMRPERRPRGRITQEIANWVCCECGNGPISIKLHASCPGRENGCSHVRCELCEGNYADDGGELEVLAIGPYDSWRNEESPLAETIMRKRGREMGEERRPYVES